MARHNNRNRVASDRSPHRTRRHNGVLVSRYTMSSRNTLGDLAIRSDLATRNRKQLVPDFTLKRRANQMQRRRIPRLLPRKISIQPSPRTLKHRRGHTICRTHRRHATGTGNRVGAFNMFGVFPEKRGTKVLLPLKPKPRQTAAISGKQDFAQRRSKCRRDHQRLLSKLRNIIPRIVQTTPIDPKVTQGSRRDSAPAAARPQSPRRQQAQRAAAAGRAPQPPPRQQAQSAEAAARGPGPATTTCPHISQRPQPTTARGPGPATTTCPHISQRPQPTTAPSWAARSNVTAGGGRAWFSEHSADQCGALSAAPKEQDKRHTWSRTF